MEEPWALMGRSVHEHHLTLTRDQIDELALGAVSDEAGVGCGEGWRWLMMYTG